MATSSQLDENLRTLADSLVEVLVQELLAEAPKANGPDATDDAPEIQKASAA